MYDPQYEQFRGRLERLERMHRRGYGFEAPGTIGRSYYRSRSTLRLPLWRSLGMIALAVIDLETLTVSDHVVLPMLLFGLVYAGVRDGWGGLGAAIVAGLIGAMFPLFVMVVSKYVMRRDGVGSGDVTMTAGFSVYLVDPVAHQFVLKFLFIAFALAIAAVAALVGTGLVALISRTTLREKEIPFVPWLAIGAWTAYMFGEQIKNFYIAVAIERAFG